MNRLCLNAGAITLVALVHLATPLIAEEANQALRSIAEEQTKYAFDQAISKFRKAAQEKNSHVFDKESNDMERVIDAIKSLVSLGDPASRLPLQAAMSLLPC